MNTTISTNTNQNSSVTVNGCTLTIENCVYNFSASEILLQNFGTLVLLNCTFICSQNYAIWNLNNGKLFVNNSLVISQPSTYTFEFGYQGLTSNVWCNSDMASLTANNQTIIVNTTIGNLGATSDITSLNISLNSIINSALFSGQANLTLGNLTVTNNLEVDAGNFTISNSIIAQFTTNDYAVSTLFNCSIGNLSLIQGTVGFNNCSFNASGMNNWQFSDYYIQGCIFQNCKINPSLNFTGAENISAAAYSFNPNSAQIGFEYYALTSGYIIQLYYQINGTGGWNVLGTPTINLQTSVGSPWELTTEYGYFLLPWNLGGDQLTFYLVASDLQGNYGKTPLYQTNIQLTWQQQYQARLQLILPPHQQLRPIPPLMIFGFPLETVILVIIGVITIAIIIPAIMIVRKKHQSAIGRVKNILPGKSSNST